MQNEKNFLKIQYPYVGHVGHFVGAIILLCLCWLLVIANAALAAARTPMATRILTVAPCWCRLFYAPGSYAAAHWPGYKDPGETENTYRLPLGVGLALVVLSIKITASKSLIN